MNIMELGALGEFVGSIAVVITLIYLALQLKQNTASVRASAYQTWVAANLALNHAVSNLGPSLRKGIEDSAQLTEDTEAVFGLWNHGFYQLLQATDYLYRMGAIDRDLWEAEMDRAAGHLQMNPGVQQWWNAGGRTQLTPRFVALVESKNPTIQVWGWKPDKGYTSG